MEKFTKRHLYSEEYGAFMKQREKVEKKIPYFFKDGIINYGGFEKYVTELEEKNIKPIDSKTGKSKVHTHKVTSKAVAHAKRLFWGEVEEFEKREKRKEKDPDKLVLHYQRNVRNKLKEAEDFLLPGDRVRILKLYVEMRYKKKLEAVQIAKVWGIGRPGAVKHLTKYTSEVYGHMLKVTKSGKKNMYSLNEKYVFMGAKKGKKTEHDVQVYLEFLEKIIQKVETIESDLAVKFGVKELEHSALSCLHALIPYFHVESYYAVENPLEKVLEEGETMDDVETRWRLNKMDSPLEYIGINYLASILSKGRTRKENIKRDLAVLQRAGAIVYTDYTILINPQLMFAMDTSLNDREKNPYVNRVLNDFYRMEQAIKKNTKKSRDWWKEFVPKEEK